MLLTKYFYYGFKEQGRPSYIMIVIIIINYTNFVFRLNKVPVSHNSIISCRISDGKIESKKWGK